MNPGCIYLRNGDHNTPNNGNAEILQIENLWKKRLGLTKPPLDYIIDRLQNKLEWSVSGEYYYNIYRPELILHVYLEDDKPNPVKAFYVYSQINERCTLGMLDILNNVTTLYRHELIWIDSNRLCIPIPEEGFIYTDEYHFNSIYYRYYLKDSYALQILQFFYDNTNIEERNAWERLMTVVIMFDSDSEQKDFEKYASSNIEKLKKMVTEDKSFEYINIGDKNVQQIVTERLRYGKALKRLLLEMRKFNKIIPK